MFDKAKFASQFPTRFAEITRLSLLILKTSSLQVADFHAYLPVSDFMLSIKLPAFFGVTAGIDTGLFSKLLRLHKEPSRV